MQVSCPGQLCRFLLMCSSLVMVALTPYATLCLHLEVEGHHSHSLAVSLFPHPYLPPSTDRPLLDIHFRPWADSNEVHLYRSMAMHSRFLAGLMTFLQRYNSMGRATDDERVWDGWPSFTSCPTLTAALPVANSSALLLTLLFHRTLAAPGAFSGGP